MTIAWREICSLPSLWIECFFSRPSRWLHWLTGLFLPLLRIPASYRVAETQKQKNTACKSDKHRLSNKGVWKSSQGKKPVSKLFPRSASHKNGDNLQPFAIIILKASSSGIDPADLKFSMEESWLIILLHSSSLQLGLYLSCAWPGVHLLPACTSTPGNDPSLFGTWGGAKPTYRHGIPHGTYMCAILDAPNPKILDIGDEENEGSPVTKTVIAWRDRKWVWRCHNRWYAKSRDIRWRK